VQFDEPTIEQRAEQPYAALNASITMGGYGILGGLFEELFGWLGQRGIAPVGPPFVRYLIIDMERQLDIQVAIPVAEPVAADGRVVNGTLPSGSYVTLSYRATTQEEHIAGNAHLQEWVKEQELRWKNTDDDGRELWGGRIEISEEPGSDPEGEETLIAYLIED
jgi:effector-binding domain-containing protein